MKRRQSAFTLIEIMIGFFILIILFGIVYQIFVGGSKAAEKSRWNNLAITQLRNSTTILATLIKNSSTPVTLLANGVKDGVNSSASSTWALKILKSGPKGRSLIANSSLTTDQKIMDWYVCEAEVISSTTNALVKPGVENHYQVIFEPRNTPNVALGALKLKKTVRKFTSSSPNYCEAGPAGIAFTAVSDSSSLLVEDVASLSLSIAVVPGIPMPLTLNLSCRSMHDPKTHKESEITATPMVPVLDLP